MTYKETLDLAVDRLEAGGIPSPVCEARELMEHFAGSERFMSAEQLRKDISGDKVQKISEAVDLRIDGMPLQYILGSWTFMDCELFVGKGVLIPRDDTEVCVRECMRLAKDLKDGSVIVDLCSGSGAIAIALAKRYSRCRVTAIEYSPAAYGFLCRNIEANDAKNVVPLMDDITECAAGFSDGSIDVLISNPPYIRTSEIPALQKEVQSEPVMALDGGDDGLRFYRVIARQWVRKIKSGGIISLEIGEDQADQVSAMLYECGVRDLKTTKDIAGYDRTISGIVQ